MNFLESNMILKFKKSVRVRLSFDKKRLIFQAKCYLFYNFKKNLGLIKLTENAMKNYFNTKVTFTKKWFVVGNQIGLYVIF